MTITPTTHPGSAHSDLQPPRQRRGLTLMELVVVLTILAAMATAAAVATERIVSQKRFTLTQETLTAARRAILGRYGEGEAVDGRTAQVEGFVADLGRLPAALGDEPALQPAELWANAMNMEPYGWKQSSADAEVWLACGWRGPYLDRAISSSEQGLLDGWGRPLLVLTADSTGQPQTAAEGDPIVGLTSLGSDGNLGVPLADAPPLAEDMTAWLAEGGLPSWQTDVRVLVWEYDTELGQRVPPQGSGTLVVRLFGPNPTTGGVMHVESPPQVGPFTQPASVTFSALPVGPKVIRAYWVGDDASTRTTSPMPIEVSTKGVVQFELVLPAAPPTLPGGGGAEEPEA